MHTHKTCDHDKVKYCKDCQAVFCENCDQRFEKPCMQWHGGTITTYTGSNVPSTWTATCSSHT